MLRELSCGVVSLALIAPSAALALSVEDYELNSYLSQPLNLEIKLADLKGLNESDIRINLATPEEFAAAGVDFEPLHNSLSFDLDLVSDSTGVVRVTTRQPINEPFISFLVEYQWPSGRLMREYNLLLDPPSYRSPAAAPLTPAAREATSPSITSTPTSRPATSTASQKVEQRSEVRASGQEYKVTASDTLWNIAAKHRPDSSISVQQMMVVVQELNPDAFIDGNINLVKEGAVLRLPEAEDVRSIGPRDAMAEVALQNRQWQSRLKHQEKVVVKVTQKPLDGKDVAAVEHDAEVETSATVDAGRVTLIAADDNLSDSKESSAKGVDTIIVNEDISRLQRENSELADRLTDLEEQLSLSAELLTLRSQQIAQLESKLKELNEGVAAELDNEFLAAVEELEREQQKQKELAELEEAAMSAEKAEQNSLLAADGAATESAVSESTEDSALTAENEEPSGVEIIDTESAVEVEDIAPISEDATDSEASTEAKPVAPVITPQPYEEPSFLDALFENSMLLLGLLALLGLAIVLLVLRAIRARKEKSEEDVGLALSDDEDDSYDPFHLDEFGESSVDDLAREAQVLIESREYDAAVSVLRNAINQEPSRVELRKSLLLALYQSNPNAYQQEVIAVKGTNATLDAYIAELDSSTGKNEEVSESDISLDDLEDDLKLDVEASALSMDEDDINGGDFDFGFEEEASEDDLSFDLEDTLLADVDEDSLDDFDFSFDDENEKTSSEKIEPTLEAAEDLDDFSFELDTTEKLDDALTLDSEDDELQAVDGVENELDLTLPTLDGSDTKDISLGELSLEGVGLDFDEETELELSENDLEFESQVELGELDLSELTTEEESPLTLETEEALGFEELSLVDAPEEDESSVDLPELEVGEDFELDSFESFTSDKAEGADLSDVDSLLAELDDFDSELDSDDLSSELERELKQMNQEATPVSNTAVVASVASVATASAQGAEKKTQGDAESELVDPEAESDPVDTRLNLARAFLDMGDEDIARETLEEVMAEGNAEQKALASAMLDELDA